MKKNEFRALLQRWCLEDVAGRNGIEELKRDVEFLERRLFNEYTVTAHGEHGAFGVRLARWIGNLTADEDRKDLYRVLSHLFFIGNSEQEAAHRTAYSKHVMQWLMVTAGISPFDEGANQQIEYELRSTRFTEITDSFGIREFLLLNGIQGENVRYRWEGQTENWDANSFRTDVLRERCPGEHRRKNIVLLEDFVGSGSQMAEAVKLVCSLGPTVNVLLCPIVICPVGARYARVLARHFHNLTFSPVLELERRFFIRPRTVQGEDRSFREIRKLLNKVHPKVAGGFQEFGPFGYRDSGGFVVPSTNCPDNTVPAIHRKVEGTWEPLFLRNSREPI